MGAVRVADPVVAEEHAHRGDGGAEEEEAREDAGDKLRPDGGLERHAGYGERFGNLKLYGSRLYYPICYGLSSQALPGREGS